MNSLTRHSVTNRLNQTLPGKWAHQKMLPTHRKLEFSPSELANFHRSAVVILLQQVDDKLFTFLVKRSSKMRNHPRQIGFPGGRVEAFESYQEAAIREGMEEINLDAAECQIIGKLSEMCIPTSQFIIHPFVAWCTQKDFQIASPDEIECIIKLPLNEFIQQDLITHEMVCEKNTSLLVPAYKFQEHIIWGASGMILSELIEVLR
ncbi:MAG: NUDIX hydrolase [Mangrovibacterium sp.]